MKLAHFNYPFTNFELLQIKNEKLAYQKAHSENDVIIGTIGLIFGFMIDFHITYPVKNLGHITSKTKELQRGKGGNTPGLARDLKAQGLKG